MKNLGLENYPFQSVLVDDCDYDRVSRHKWYYNSTNNSINSILYNDKWQAIGSISLSRFILNISDSDILVDHRDRNIFNNTQENLRPCDRSQNGANRTKLSSNTSGYKGVYFNKIRQKWQASIMINKKQITLGRFNNKEMAAKVYDKAAKELFGEFACLNFPEKE